MPYIIGREDSPVATLQRLLTGAGVRVGANFRSEANGSETPTLTPARQVPYLTTNKHFSYIFCWAVRFRIIRHGAVLYNICISRNLVRLAQGWSVIEKVPAKIPGIKIVGFDSNKYIYKSSWPLIGYISRLLDSK